MHVCTYFTGTPRSQLYSKLLRNQCFHRLWAQHGFYAGEVMRNLRSFRSQGTHGNSFHGICCKFQQVKNLPLAYVRRGYLQKPKKKSQIANWRRFNQESIKSFQTVGVTHKRRVQLVLVKQAEQRWNAWLTQVKGQYNKKRKLKSPQESQITPIWAVDFWSQQLHVQQTQQKPQWVRLRKSLLKV